MKSIPLTVVVPNKDRFDFNRPSSQFWLKSLLWQDYNNFKVVVMDGGSKNYNEIKKRLESIDRIRFIVFQHKIEGVFHKTLLNNIAIKKCDTEYIATTDADLVYDKRFIGSVIPLLEHDTMIESRTMYWKGAIVEKIYKGELDPFNNIDSCKKARIKKRTTCGGFQCLHKDQWDKIGMYDERYKYWGSEDQDLLHRAVMAGIKVKWLGESVESVMVFHQPHPKNIEEELKWQYKNLAFFNNIKNFKANVS